MPPQAFEQLSELAALENRRSAGSGRVVALATGAKEAPVRARAFRVIARLQDPAALQVIRQGLVDPAAEVRAEAAFAAWSLGLAWHPLSEEVRAGLSEALLARESEEKDGAVRSRLLRALGRMATAGANARLVERLASDGSPPIRISAALALGVAQKRGDALPSGGVSGLGKMIDPALHEGVRFAAAYALAFIRSPEALPLLATLVKDADPEIRLLGAKGLGTQGCGSHAVLAALLDDPDWRVVVEATRSLTGCADADSIRALEGLLSLVDVLQRGQTARGAQPLLTFAQARLGPPMLPLIERVRDRIALAAREAGAPLGDLGNIDCRLAAARVSVTGALRGAASCGFGVVAPEARQALLLRGLAAAAHVDAEAVSTQVRLLAAADPSVRSAALALLVAHGSRQEQAFRLRALARDEKDLPLAGAALSSLAKLEGSTAAERAADALAARALIRKLDVAPDLAEPVLRALVTLEGRAARDPLERLLQFPHAHVRNTAAALLGELTQQPVMAPLVESAEVALAPRVKDGARLRIRTAKGDFTLVLFTDEAPQTSAKLVALARQGFFANLTFHRVVPDFVVQGGDPRGDGEGGPGFTLRCEVSPRPYSTGTVGIALAGKDTGGSQFFVTHSPQPHLEGRYPVLGQLESGQDVVDSLLEGDRILGVDVLTR